ncbi:MULTISPECIES: hypothetical protein [Rhizobium/Agrobacterium group]|uniref:Holin n=2 Tax=Neorhizobium TaxID=1525371 RepID=A0ABV0M990_9HYPH|nr:MULTISPECIES: hypothetical protein [Rhizobium/Agrobacterium group]KGD85801.1 hypothetical protein JL39_26710 [Rhizobium sp. YS-1r]MCC2609056.1 hypothetical protein [Neorhizobium petrolearium]WGI69292.1 hypothetical protein QEO92_04185 [Neorhizobium petrolearium]
MDGMKAWYQSKTVWGALIAVGASLLQVAGIELGADMQADLADIAVTLAGAAGGLLAIYGRISADTGIRGK